MSTDKTLADVQPGGRVRLGDQAERARFEAWARAQSYRGGNILTDRDADHPDVYSDPLAQLTWKSWKAALSAQPSPGGQGETLVTDAMVMAALQAVTRETLAGVGDCDSKVIGVLTAYGIDGAVDIPTMVRAMLEAALAARQPVGQEPLWCLHVLGMDDVHPAPSKAHAEKAAAWHNEQFKDQAARLRISIEAKVVPWPHSAESHAAGVAEFIPQWLVPQWQLDALESTAARQPVGEPFGYCADFDPGAHEFSHTFYYLAPGEKVPEGCTPFFTKQPAQAVDLDAVSALLQRRIEQWRSHLPADPGAPGTREIETNGEHDYNNDVRIYREGIAVMEEVLRTIDGQAVCNG